MSYDDSPQCLPTIEVIEALHDAVEEAAERNSLSSRLLQIYGTWIYGFVCWCLRTPPNRVTPDRIESFRRRLIQDTDADRRDEEQALDALAFFFGVVNVDDLNVQTSRNDWPESSSVDGADYRPFVYYNQVDPPDLSPLSPMQDPVARSERSLTDTLMPTTRPRDGIAEKAAELKAKKSRTNGRHPEHA